MTTIAYRSGTLAADSLIAYSAITNGSRPKIAQKGKHIVALAGNAWLREPLEEWVEAGCPRNAVPKVLIDNDEKFQCLIIDEDGQAFSFDCGYLVPIYADYTAIGSGAMLAMGAMAHGADAEAAVRAAALHDKNTGGEIHSLALSSLN